MPLTLPQLEALPEALPRLLEAVRRRETEMIDRILALVCIESPSGNKPAVDHAQTLLTEWASAAGGEVLRHRFPDYGDSTETRFLCRQNAGLRPIILLGHLDTVWDLGTLEHMPLDITKDLICGPGVLDMKAGVVMALTAIQVVRELDPAHRPFTLLLHGDEEIGSPSSRALTEKVARGAAAVYVLEPAQGDAGAYKTARKGVGRYRLTVSGKAAHSGVDFEQGHSAVVELARQIEIIQSFTDLGNGLTVNPGVIGGGTASNVVAAEAWVEIDVRLVRANDAAEIDRLLRSLAPVDKACTLQIVGGLNRPPMERSQGTGDLFDRAQQLAAGLGFSLAEAATGGASDGNFTAALGVPTLDGMGAVGAGAHAPHEHLRREHLALRTALLAAMLL